MASRYPDHIDQVPEKVKMLVFKGETRQIEGIMAALRTLHLPKDEIITSILQIFKVMGAIPHENNKPLGELLHHLDNPKEFARNFVYILPPVTSLPVNDIPKINEKLLKLLTAA